MASAVQVKDVKIPKVYWHQSPHQLELKVLISDVVEYEFGLIHKTRKLFFSCPNYGFEFILSGDVMKNPVVQVTGPHVKIVLIKAHGGVWDRITEHPAPWLTYDPEFLDEMEEVTLDDITIKEYVPIRAEDQTMMQFDLDQVLVEHADASRELSVFEEDTSSDDE